MPGTMFDKLVRIDMTSRTSRLWDVPESVRQYLGGMGYGTKILLDEVDPASDPLSAENKVILTVGPLTGTSVPMHAQSCIVTKSPLTGTILNSYAGGFVGAEIKFCGIDGIVFEGACDRWTLILVENDTVSFHSAEPVVGKNTSETEAYMRERFGDDVRTISIGKAGENLVAMASVFSETRTYGRGGAGAVFGSKKIKGIAFRGNVPVQAVDQALLNSLVAEDMEKIKAALAEQYNLVGMFSRAGTGTGVGLINSRGSLATMNHIYGSFDRGEEIDGYTYMKKFYTRPIACYGCPVHCGMLRKFKKRDNTDSWLRGPEYETMFSLGSDLVNADPVVLAEANQLCEEYGMDTLTTGVTIAWALEMGELGVLKVDGLTMEFGNGDAILKLLEMIGEREGIGDSLAKGPGNAARELSKEHADVAMQIKNSGFAAWMPRRMKGTGLAFATSNRGACHKRAPIGAEIIGHVDMDSYDGKAAMVKSIQDMVNAIFSLVSCRFHEFIADPEIYPKYLKAAIGADLTLEEFKRTGERIWNMERLFNVRAGFSRKDDALPGRCFVPIKGENSEGAVMDLAKFNTMLDEYYTIRGWDVDGIPTKETLEKLDILQ